MTTKPVNKKAYPDTEIKYTVNENIVLGLRIENGVLESSHDKPKLFQCGAPVTALSGSTFIRFALEESWPVLRRWTFHGESWWEWTTPDCCPVCGSVPAETCECKCGGRI